MGEKGGHFGREQGAFWEGRRCFGHRLCPWQITEGVKPTLSELEKFEDQPEGIDLEVVTESTGTQGGFSAWAPPLLAVPPAASWSLNFPGKEREHNFQPGDNVEVCEGELINLQGKILSVDGNKITIMPKHEDLKVAESPVCSSGGLRGVAVTTPGLLPCASLLSPPPPFRTCWSSQLRSCASISRWVTT